MASVSVVHGKGRHIQKEPKKNEKHLNGSKIDLSVANGSNKNIISSGSSEHAMDDYLKKLDLYRKPVAKDGSCLFRVIAEQVYNTQERHLDVRRECIQYMQQNRSHFEAFVEGSFDHHLHQLRNSREWGGQVEISALSMLYKCDFIVYQAVDQEPQEVTCNGFEKKILLCFSNGNHYDAVYPTSFRSNAAFMQAILYNHLLTAVFPVIPDHVEEQSLTSEVPSEAFVGNGSVESGRTEVKTKPKGAKSADDPDPIIAAIPDAANNKDIYWQIKRSLDPGNYRNIELEVWNSSRADQQKQDHVVAVAMQFKVGDSCLARLRDFDSGEQLHNVKIEEIIEDNHLYSVSGPGLKGRVTVPLADLQPLVMGDAFDESYKSWPGYYNKSDAVRDGEFHAQKRRGRGGRRTREEARKGEGGGTNLGRGTAESGRRERAGFHGRNRPGRRDGERKNKESTDFSSRNSPEESVTSDAKSEDNSEPVIDSDMASPSLEKAPTSSDGGLGNDQPQKVALSTESPAAFWGRMRSSVVTPLSVRDGISANNLSQVADQGNAKSDQSVEKTEPATPTGNAPDADDILPIAQPMSHVPGLGSGQSATVNNMKATAAAKQHPSATVHTKHRGNVGNYPGSPIMEIGVPSKSAASKAVSRSEPAKKSLISPTSTAISVSGAPASTTWKASASIPRSAPTAVEELKGQWSPSASKLTTIPASSVDAHSLNPANARVVKAGEHIAASGQVPSFTSDDDAYFSASLESSPTLTSASEFSFIDDISVGSSDTEASGCTSDSLGQRRAQESGDAAHCASDQSTARTVPQHVKRNEKHVRNKGVAPFMNVSNITNESSERELTHYDRGSDIGLTACSTLPYVQEFVPRTGSVARKPTGQSERSHSQDVQKGDDVECLPSPTFNPSPYTASPDAFGSMSKSECELRGKSVPEEIVALPPKEREKSKKKVSFNLMPERKGKANHSNLQAAQVPVHVVQSEPGKIVLPQEHMEKHMSELAAMQSQQVSISPQVVVPQSSYLQADVASLHSYSPFQSIIPVLYPSVDHLSFPQFSRDPEGKDLPEDRDVLKFFYNLGVQFYYGSMQTQQHPQAGIFPSQQHPQAGIFSYPMQQHVAVQHYRPLLFQPTSEQSSQHTQSQTLPQMSSQLPEPFVPVNQLTDSRDTDLLVSADDRLLPSVASASHQFHMSTSSPIANMVGPSSHESGYDYPPSLRRAMTSHQTSMHSGHQGPRSTSSQRSYSGGPGIMGPGPSFLPRSDSRHNPQMSNRLNYPMNGQYQSSSFSHR